jgi:hypothetical protein
MNKSAKVVLDSGNSDKFATLICTSGGFAVYTKSGGIERPISHYLEGGLRLTQLGRNAQWLFEKQEPRENLRKGEELVANLRQPFKRRPSPQKAQFGKLIWLAAIAQNEAGASSATSGRCVLPGNAPLILRRRSANENGENCSDRSSRQSRCYNRGLLQQTA